MPTLSYLPDTVPVHSRQDRRTFVVCASVPHRARAILHFEGFIMRIKTSAAVVKRVGRGATCLLLGATALGLLLIEPAKTSGQAAASAGANKPGYTDDFAKLGMKFEGASTCSNAKCHGADEPKPSGATTTAEFTQWSNGDPHAN